MTTPQNEIVEGVAAALKRLDNDQELLFELFDVFEEDLEQSLTRIEQSLDPLDWKELEESSHAMKSALGNIGAKHACAICLELELAGRNNTNLPFAGKMEELKVAIDAYRGYMRSIKGRS